MKTLIPSPENCAMESAPIRVGLTTYEVVIATTGRVLRQNFHIETAFSDSPLTDETIAEFGSPKSAWRLIAMLDYSVALTVRCRQWPFGLEGAALRRVTRAVGDTGACSELLELRTATALWHERVVLVRSRGGRRA